MKNNNQIRIILPALLLMLLLTGCSASELGGNLRVPSDYRYSGSYDYSRALASRNQVYEPGDSQLNLTVGDLPASSKDYTLMVYMIGSNLESRTGNGTKDLLEMQSSELDFEKNNLLVCTGGSQRWMGRVPCDRNSVLDLSREGEQIVAQTVGNADMGAPYTLAAFINFCHEHYPAEHYALILWDHGGGPLWGYGSDELFESDSLLLSEMMTGMDQTPFAGGEKLDWVGFDACLMGTLECMSLWSDYADYYVASEELEPGDGWDYSFLNALNNTSDPAEVTGSIVDSYGAYYEKIKSETYNPDVTLSCIDLKQAKRMMKAINSLAGAMKKSVEGTDYAQVQKVRSETKSFGLIEGAKGEQPFSYDLVDVGDFAERLKEMYPEESARVLSTMDEMVVKKYANVEASAGISLYYPFHNKGQYAEMASVYQQTGMQGEYMDFLNALTGQWLSSKSRDWTLGQLTSSGDEFTLELTQEQQENLTAAFYTILMRMENGAYTPVLTRNRIEPDAQGVLHIPADPEVLCLKTDSGNSFLCPAVQLETGRNRSVYRTDRTRLVTDSNFTFEFGRYNADLLDISVVLFRDEQSGELQVQTVNALTDDASFGGKSTVNTEHYEGIYYYSHSVLPTHDSEGHTCSFSQWMETGSAIISGLSMNHSFGFELKPASEASMGCVIQVELEDTNGEFYASELSGIQTTSPYQEKSIKTKQGDLTYHIYHDHAEVAEYSGVDTSLTIPARVEGVDVTRIQSNAFGRMKMNTGNAYLRAITLPDTIEELDDEAFAGCVKLKEIKLPKSIKTIGDSAFIGCLALKQLEVPEGVTAIGRDAFSFCTSLEHLSLPTTLTKLGDGVCSDCNLLNRITLGGQDDGECSGCKLQNGVLFSADGKRLIAFPAAREGTYQVPAGTQTICFAAFSRTNLSSIVFPSTLTEIRNSAFRDCKKLQVPVFPENLTSIGHHAFGSADSSLSWTEQVLEEQEVHIGANVSFIGAGAFDAFLGRRFTVDEKNPWFSAVDGALCNGEGDTCIASVSTGQPVVVIPEGITSFDWDMLSFLSDLDYMGDYNFTSLDVVLPDTVTSFSDYDSDFGNKVIIHCSRGSAAEQYAKENDIPWDDKTQLNYQESTQTTPHGTAHYYLYEDHAQLVSYEGTDAVLEIPSQVDGKPVTVIGDGEKAIQEASWLLDSDAPQENVVSGEEEAAELEKVIVPDTVVELSNNALGMISLESVQLPEGLRVMGENSVRISTLEHLPKSLEYIGRGNLDGWEGDFVVTPAMTWIASDAFGYGNVPKFVIDGENETFSVRDGILYDKEGKTLLIAPRTEGTLTVPEETARIGENAFHGQQQLTQVILPDSVTAIGNSAFESTGLTAMPSSANLEIIGDYAFHSCNQMTAANLPGSLRTIGSNAFSGCETLSQVSFSEGLESIGDSAFAGCPHLIDIQLPDSLIEIGEHAFHDYDQPVRTGKVDAISIGGHVKKIGEQAFGSIPAQRFVVSEENTQFAAKGGMLTDKNGNMLIECPALLSGSVSVPEGIVGIDFAAFDNGNQIIDLYVPDSVQHIDDAAFHSEGVEDEDGGNGDFKRLYTITLHSSEGSYCQQYAAQYGIPWALDSGADAAQAEHSNEEASYHSGK